MAWSRVHRNSVPSTHMRCMITANRRASATIAFFIPRCLAIFIAQALSQDHFAVRTSSAHDYEVLVDAARPRVLAGTGQPPILTFDMLAAALGYASEPSAVSIRTLPPKAASHSRGRRVVCRSANQANPRRSLVVLVWVLYAFVELFLYLPLLSGAFLAYAQVWGTDPMPAAFWWRDIGSAIGESRRSFSVKPINIHGDVGDLGAADTCWSPGVDDAPCVCTSVVSLILFVIEYRSWPSHLRCARAPSSALRRRWPAPPLRGDDNVAPLLRISILPSAPARHGRSAGSGAPPPRARACRPGTTLAPEHRRCARRQGTPARCASPPRRHRPAETGSRPRSCNRR